MDLGTDIVAIIIVVICLLPFIFIARGRKKREKKMLTSLEEVAKKDNCTVNDYDINAGFIIGIDHKQNQVFYYKNEEGVINQGSVNLTGIKKCKIATHTKAINAKNRKEYIVEGLDLKFIPRYNQDPEVSFTVYDSDLKMQLTGELQLAKKWETLINKKLLQFN
ncbi:hypothetical protein KLA_07921 [Cellulophaga geojensis KL-A]|uniref:Uncharacterized protein n=2 Tax=Cellulophaga TaxID=104264 RepID=A0ABN0RP76_9FLAO|nr:MULTISPECIES: hypothetical protein [Cellulophaga]EWH13710.1 hypothetical protein KLA_07921 [Cellulophaga geojensis KL-A]MDO6853577.1 hypothetical protein [Cellulophaga lytica]